MTTATCPTHAAAHPLLWNPEGLPCPFRGCPSGTIADEIHIGRERYIRSIYGGIDHWVYCVDVVSVCAYEGT